MSIWDGFSDEELYTILECSRFKEIRKKITRKFDRDEWIRAARNSYAIEQQNKLIMESFLFTVRESTKYSYLVLLGVIGSITVAFIPLSIMTAVLSVVALASGISFFSLSHQAVKRARETAIKELDFNTIKMMCADEIISRKKIQLASAMRDSHAGALMMSMHQQQAPEFEYKLKHKSDKTKEAAVFGMAAGSLLFGTYFAGLAILLNSFGLIAISGMMLGPIGMSVSLAAAIGIGVICAYMRYRTIIKEDKLAQFMKFQKEQISDKQAECYALKKKTKNLPLQPKIQRTLSEPHLRASHFGVTDSRSPDDVFHHPGFH